MTLSKRFSIIEIVEGGRCDTKAASSIDSHRSSPPPIDSPQCRSFAYQIHCHTLCTGSYHYFALLQSQQINNELMQIFIFVQCVQLGLSMVTHPHTHWLTHSHTPPPGVINTLVQIPPTPFPSFLFHSQSTYLTQHRKFFSSEFTSCPAALDRRCSAVNRPTSRLGIVGPLRKPGSWFRSCLRPELHLRRWIPIESTAA